MKFTWRPVLVAMLLIMSACGNPDAELQAEVASLRGDVSVLSDQVAASQAADELTPTTQVAVTTTTVAVTATTIVSTTIGPVIEPLPLFPSGLKEFTHGGDVWVVILAASEGSSDPGLKTATIAAADAGYSAFPTDCDFGASEALGLPQDRSYYTVSVYLTSEADANSALQSFERLGVGGVVAKIQTFCLD